MDDMEPNGRHALLRDAFRSFNVYGPDKGTAEERAAHCYREFKERFSTLMQMLPEEDSFVFGMVCFTGLISSLAPMACSDAGQRPDQVIESNGSDSFGPSPRLE